MTLPEPDVCPYSKKAFEGAEHYRMCDLFTWCGCIEAGWRDNYLKCDMLKLADKILAERGETVAKQTIETMVWQPKWKNQL